MLCAVFAAADALQISGIEVDDGAEVSKVSIVLDAAAKYRVFTLANPPRIVVDVLGSAELAGSLVLQSKRIKSFRHARHSSGNYRIAFDLSDDFSHRHYLARAKDTDAARIVLEIGALRTTSSPLSQTKPPQKKPPETGTSQAKFRNLVVIVDPGHGGKDSGAIGKTGSHEKDIVLAVSKEIRKFLQKQFGIDAYLTRDTDEHIVLRDRVKIAEEKKADIFLSIHADSLPEEYVSGSSVYILSEDGASSEAARLLAQRESKDVFVGDIGVSDKEVASVVVELVQSATLEYSEAFAKTMIQVLGEDFKVRQKIESAGFAVLKSLEIPSLLIELGYLSNSEEEEKLKQPEYQKRIAVAVGRGVKRYLEENPTSDSWIGRYTVSPYTVVSGDSLWRLARRQGVSIRLIKQLSDLQSDGLQIGQKLLLPSKKDQ